MSCGEEQYIDAEDNEVKSYINKVMKNEIFGLIEIDAEVKPEFKYLWDQFPPFIVKTKIDVNLIGSEMNKYYEKTKKVPTQNALIAVAMHKNLKHLLLWLNFWLTQDSLIF